MSQSKSPTMSHSFGLYNLLIDKVEDFIDANLDKPIYYNAANAALFKLKDYYSKTDYNILYVPSISNSIF